MSPGANTKPLRRGKSVDRRRTCLSLLWKKQGRSLDIEAETQADRDRLAWAFGALLRTPGLLKPTESVNPLIAAGGAGGAGSPGRANGSPRTSRPAAGSPARGGGAGRGGKKKGRRLSTLSSATQSPFAGLESKSHSALGRSTSLPIEWAAISRPGNNWDGQTKTNQDSMIVHDTFGGKARQMFVGVMDGHGPNGHFASQFVRDQLPRAWASGGIDCERPGEVMRRTCLQVNKALHASSIDCFVSGSTCIASYIRDDVIYTANIGDSRCVVGRLAGGKIKAIDLSDDHKPDRPDEQRRIEASGGEVFEDGVWRVYQAGMEIPGLAMARSFGDLCAERVGVTAEPEISEHKITESDQFCVWASDGVWEFIDSQQCCEMIWEKMQADGAAQAGTHIVKVSVDKWHEEEDLVVDDTTIIIAVLNYGR